MEAKDAAIDGAEQQVRLLAVALSKQEHDEMEGKVKATRSLYQHTVTTLQGHMDSLSKAAGALMGARRELEEAAAYVAEKKIQLQTMLASPIRSHDIPKCLDRAKVGSLRLDSF